MESPFARATALLLVTSFVPACTGAPNVLPPREPPPRSAPQLPEIAAPIPQGRERVVLTTTDGPMKITARADTEFVPPGGDLPPTRVGDLCTTPCVADLPPGQYKLYLNAPDGTGDVDELTLRGEGSVTYYARAPGKFERPSWPIFPTALLAIGATLLIVGTSLVAAPDQNGGTQGAGYGTLVGGGLAAIIGGALWYDQSRGSTQEGATTVWSAPSR